MKDTKNIPTNAGSDPEYIALQKEQMSLCVAQQKRDIERSKIQVISDRVEQARRNVEVIARGIGGFSGDGTKKVYNKMEEILLLNLETLKEVKDIR